MKTESVIAAFAFTAIIALSPVPAQTRRAPNQPAAAPAGGPIPDSKIAVIYSADFTAEKTGIAKFGALVNALNKEFEVRKKEIDALQQKTQQLNDEIEKTRPVADPKQTQLKMEQLAQLKRDFQRKSEDAQAAYDKRQQEIFQPLQDDIGKALEAYAKAHAINLVIDGSRVPVVYAADSLDITRAFIDEFNSKNPATTQVTPR
jgi:Skp family chaperone for outer membrane proteins